MSIIVENIMTSKKFSPEIIIKAHEGLIPIRKTVNRKGKTYQQIFWTRPQDLRKMDLENAANFMTGMVKAQQYFKAALEKLDAEGSMDTPLKQAAAEIRAKMEATGKKLVELGDLKLEMVEHSRANPVSGDALLAAIQSKPESAIPHKIKGIITALYQDVSTTTFGSGLKVGSSTIRTTAAVKSTQWDAKSWATKMKDIMGKKIAEVKGIFSFRKVAPNNAALVVKEGLKRTPTSVPTSDMKTKLAEAVAKRAASPEIKVYPKVEKIGKKKKKVVKEERIVVNQKIAKSQDLTIDLEKTWSPQARARSLETRRRKHRPHGLPSRSELTNQVHSFLSGEGTMEHLPSKSRKEIASKITEAMHGSKYQVDLYDKVHKTLSDSPHLKDWSEEDITNLANKVHREVRQDKFHFKKVG